MNIPRFWREIPSRYNLKGTKCENCGKVHFPPRIICPRCHRESIGRMKTYKLNGKGEVLTYTVIHNGPRSFEMQVPYVMAIIKMDDGLNLTGQLIDCEAEEVRIGMRVKTTFRKIDEDGECGVIHYGYKFVPAEPGGQGSARQDSSHCH